MSYEFSLLTMLKSKDKKMFNRLDEIKDRATKLLTYTHSLFPYYTSHDFTHSESVVECLNWLIPDSIKSKLNSKELFLLIVSAWLHDWGMIGSKNEDPDYVRENHHIRSEIKINQYYSKIGLNIEEAELIGKICKGHRKEDLFSDYYNPMPLGHGININIRFLSALVRLADELDITSQRVSEIMYHEMDYNSDEAKHFQTHLRITGIAYHPEKNYKIVFAGIAYGNKGADILQKIEEKMQLNLDSVKSILAENGIIIDNIELQLTAKDFIHKSIKFKIQEEKIVDLLIGNHLYQNKVIGIRELVQNSIDACKIRKFIEPKFKGKITIQSLESNVFVITDNGIGMDFETARQFLSLIGESIRDSSSSDYLVSENLNLIAKFGIGILSAFLIADSIEIETKKKGHKAVEFKIESSKDLWECKYGTKKESGTNVKLILKDNFKDLEILPLLQKYFIDMEFPIFYQELNGNLIKYNIEWNSTNLFSLYYKDKHSSKEEPKQFIQYETDEMKVILFPNIKTTGTRNLTIFNQGIFVTILDYMMISCPIFVSLKKDIIDLHISREDIIKNSKYFCFQRNLLESFIMELNENILSNDIEMFINIISRIVRIRIREDEMHSFAYYSATLDSEFLHNHIYFPCVLNKETKVLTLKEILELIEVNIYRSFVGFSEYEFIKRFLPEKQLFIFDFYYLKIFSKSEKWVEYFIRERFNNYLNDDFKIEIYSNLEIIKAKCELIDLNDKKLLPNYIRLAKFPDEFNPIILLVEKGIFTSKNDSTYINTEDEMMLTSYFLKDTIYEKQLIQFLTYFETEKTDIDNQITTTPIFYVNINDSFICKIVNYLEKHTLTSKNREIISTYFRILPFLHHFNTLFDILGLLSSLFIVTLEKEIAYIIGTDEPSNILRRIVMPYWFFELYVDGVIDWYFEKK